MADSKITGLGELSAAPASGDLFVIVDVSDTSMAASGTNKKVTWANAVLALTNGTTTMASSQTQTFTKGITIASGAQIRTGSSSDLVLYPASGVVKFANSSGTERGYFGAGNNTWDISPLPDAAADSSFRFFRYTNTSGSKNVWIYKGDNTSTIIHALTVNAASITRFNSQGDDIDFNIRGDTDTGLFYADASTDRIGVGTPNPATKLHALESNAATNTIFDLVTLSGRSTGTVAAGFGAGVAVQLESSTTNDQAAGRLTFAWSTATHASRAAVGKLTAYYTSTEREVITWTATSSAATVDIAATTTTFAGANAEININATSGVPELIFSAAGVPEWSLYYNATYFAIAETGVGETMKLTNGGQITTTGGNFGIGVASPQGILHAHDGSGGFLFVNRTGVSSTLVTVIPDGAGDVTERLHMFGWVSNSAAFVSQVNEVYLDVSSSTTKTDGSNTLTIAVTAAGAFTLQTTLGSATWKVLLWVFWR